MSSIILTHAAGAFSHAANNHFGSFLVNSASKLAGSYIDEKIFGSKNKVQTTLLSDLNIQSSTYGKVIPKLFGTSRIAGNIIWSDKLKEHKTNSRISGKGGVRHSSSYYSISIAISICQGPVNALHRIWANGKLLNAEKAKYRFYNGSETQMPDILLESKYGKGNTPAYRGLAYIIFEDLSLAEFGNHIPNFTFEVQRSNSIFPRTEDMVESIVIIPGSGEFAYDTKIQNKVKGSYHNERFMQLGASTVINTNNHLAKADSLVALDQLENSCKNLKWVASVSSFFATSTNLAECRIVPKVEQKDKYTTEPDVWQVGKITRDKAEVITYDLHNNPIYGGTPSDHSVVRYLDELRMRKLKIMFYPFIMVDKIDKPWRGRITLQQEANDEVIRNFFHKEDGYNNFILHYADLVKGKIDAFLIGSELVGITKYKLAVKELVALSKKVKAILGPKVMVSYAADWSEYHHDEDGYFHLDELWAADSIDFVGIDAYFPITNNIHTEYDAEKLMQGFENGEYYDYYFRDTKRKHKEPLDPRYAIKNIQYWWENEHINPDGTKTKWVPKSKKIWFTEYGFPSVDNGSNQPNVFYDESSIEGKFPRHSKGIVDFSHQKACISAFIQYFSKREFVDNMFLWCYDARPYPYFPDFTNIWSDGKNWQYGHFVNGKFGSTTVGEVIAELCASSGIKAEKIGVSTLTDILEGFVVNNYCSARDAIVELQQVYFFEVIEEDEMLKFIARKNKKPYIVNKEDLVLQGEEYYKVTKTDESTLPQRLELSYINRIYDYRVFVESATLAEADNSSKLNIESAVILPANYAKTVAEVILRNCYREVFEYSFNLPIKYIYLSPGDLIEMENILRITNISLCDNLTLEVKAVTTDVNIYDIKISPEYNQMPEKFIPPKKGSSKFILLDLPKLPTEDGRNYLYAACFSTEKNWPGMELYLEDSMKLLGSTDSPATIGNAIFIDDKIQVLLVSGEIESSTQEELGMYKNLAKIGDKIIQFEHASLISDNLYEISGIIGDKLERFDDPVTFILLDEKLVKIEVPDYMLGKECKFNSVTFGNNFFDQNRTLFTPLSLHAFEKKM